MKTPARWSQDNLLAISAIQGKTAVHTQYACQVLSVSQDGRFVNVIHNTLEWEACADGDTIMINEFGKDVLCSPTKPWVITDVPVEETYERGQWKIRSRPRVGDKGILSVFYHDIKSLKEKGGFQAPDAIRVMAIDSCSWRPGLPNHADVNTSPEYPNDDEWELNGNGVKIKLTSPVDDNSESPNKMDVTVGSIQFTITAPKDGTPTITFNAPDGAITVNAKTANVNLSESATLTTPTTTVSGNVSISGTLDVGGAVTTESTITATGEITGNGIALSTHTHTVPGAAALVPPPAPTPESGVPVPTP